MRRLRIAHPATPFRPVLPNLRGPIHHTPVRNRLPQYLPVLQPPMFPRENELYEGEEQDLYAEMYYPTIVFPDQYGILARQFLNQTRNYMLSQNRYIQPTYPFYMHYNF